MERTMKDIFIKIWSYLRRYRGFRWLYCWCLRRRNNSEKYNLWINGKTNRAGEKIYL